MIISKTPFRISLIGGGTDFPSYYRKYTGCVIGGTIDKFCYITVRRMPNVFKFKHRIVWSKNETVNRNDEIIHKGKLTSLKRFKNDATEVLENYECGIGVAGFVDFKENDIIEVYEIKEVKRTLA